MAAACPSLARSTTFSVTATSWRAELKVGSTTVPIVGHRPERHSVDGACRGAKRDCRRRRQARLSNFDRSALRSRARGQRAGHSPRWAGCQSSTDTVRQRQAQLKQSGDLSTRQTMADRVRTSGPTTRIERARFVVQRRRGHVLGHLGPPRACRRDRARRRADRLGRSLGSGSRRNRHRRRRYGPGQPSSSLALRLHSPTRWQSADLVNVTGTVEQRRTVRSRSASTIRRTSPGFRRRRRLRRPGNHSARRSPLTHRAGLTRRVARRQRPPVRSRRCSSSRDCWRSSEAR